MVFPNQLYDPQACLPDSRAINTFLPSAIPYIPTNDGFPLLTIMDPQDEQLAYAYILEKKMQAARR
ncbi:hypothetical protein OH492_10045 [Vibrio chagasii]|nr:hypothetical protein [Vibrio chagasii]